MSNQTRNPKSKLPLALKLCVLFVLLVALVGGFIHALGVAATNRWERYAAELRAKGEPLTFAEIEAMRTVIPDEENGFRVLEKLLPQLEEVKVSRDERDVLILGSQTLRVELFDGFPRSAIEPSKAFVDRHRDLIVSLSQLRDTPVGRIDLDFNAIAGSPWDVSASQLSHFQHLTHVRTAAKLTNLGALMRIVEGDRDGAVQDVQVLSAIAGTLDEIPNLIGRLVQMAIEAQLSQLVEITLRTSTPTVATVRSMETTIETRLAAANVAWAFRAERASFAKIFGTPDSSRTPATTKKSVVKMPSMSWLPNWVVRRNQVEGTELLSAIIDAGDDTSALAAAAAHMQRIVGEMDFTHLFAKMMLPSLSRAITLHLKSIASLRSTHAALSAELFRMDHDRMPSSLEELVPDYLDAIPIDPFDGKPLRFATTDRGIVIYSIGENLVDDGGSMERRKTKPKRPLDVGFRLLNPEHRRVILLDDSPATDDVQP